MTESGHCGGGTDRQTVYVEEAPRRIFGNLLIDGCDGQCAYIYAGIEERCPNDAIAHTFLSSGKKVEMCAEHAREDVPEPPRNEQKELVTDGGTECYRRRGPEWEREGGEGLPPDPNMRRKLDSDEDLVTHLFTCVNCGRRLASPPGPPSDMICGNCGGDYVCHTFDPAEYARIRWYSDPRTEDEKCNVQAATDRNEGGPTDVE